MFPFRYHRCQFELPLYPENTSTGSQQYISTTPFVVTAFTKWDEAVARVRPSERPVVLNRASSTNTTNPFGSTFCYGYQDVIFEVMPNQHLAAVTLYCKAGGRMLPRVNGAGGAGHGGARNNRFEEAA